MADNLTKRRRSELMSRIKCRGTAPELALARLARKLGLVVEEHPAGLPGRPDMVLRGTMTAVFVHGCFWHRCPRHFRLPKSRTEHWRAHIAGNVSRHRRSAAALRAAGYRVAVVWEHELPRRKTQRRLTT